MTLPCIISLKPRARDLAPELKILVVLVLVRTWPRPSLRVATPEATVCNVVFDKQKGVLVPQDQLTLVRNVLHGGKATECVRVRTIVATTAAVLTMGSMEVPPGAHLTYLDEWGRVFAARVGSE
jgi:hypothetical protein